MTGLIFNIYKNKIINPGRIIFFFSFQFSVLKLYFIHTYIHTCIFRCTNNLAIFYICKFYAPRNVGMAAPPQQYVRDNIGLASARVVSDKAPSLYFSLAVIRSSVASLVSVSSSSSSSSSVNEGDSSSSSPSSDDELSFALDSCSWALIPVSCQARRRSASAPTISGATLGAMLVVAALIFRAAAAAAVSLTLEEETRAVVVESIVAMLFFVFF